MRGKMRGRESERKREREGGRDGERERGMEKERERGEERGMERTEGNRDGERRRLRDADSVTKCGTKRGGGDKTERENSCALLLSLSVLSVGSVLGLGEVR